MLTDIVLSVMVPFYRNLLNSIFGKILSLHGCQKMFYIVTSVVTVGSILFAALLHCGQTNGISPHLFARYYQWCGR
jgi:hypothetical protein